MGKSLRLWYRQPARTWVEALPLGNGRIGAMVFGGTGEELISLNEDSLWSGYPHDTNVEGAARYYRTSQRMIAEGRYAETQDFIEDTMLGPFTQSYMPMGDLKIRFEGIEQVENYLRTLRLDDATSTVQYTANGVRYMREAFVSCPDQSLILRISADKPGHIGCEISMDSQLRHQVTIEEHTLILTGICPSLVRPNYVNSDNPVIYEQDDAKKGMRFAVMLIIQPKGGRVIPRDNHIKVEGADELTIKLVARTSYNGFDKQPYLEGKDELAAIYRDRANIEAKDFEALYAAHAKDYKHYYDRVQLDLQDNQYEDQPTDQRLKQFEIQQDDRALCELIFQYGRYLVISASRPGTQASNLQGIWNRELRAPWSSNFTVNINTEMNYWPVEICNLSEMHQPLFDLIQGLKVTGARTAKVHYGARGAVSHHNADIWRLSNPVGNKGRGTAGYAFWPMSFGWLCQHLFEHYTYTMDRDFLKNIALPAIREAARFYLDVMVEDSEGRLAISPATSPENAFLYDGVVCKVSKSATMSNSIVREVFRNYLSALEILDEQEEMAEQVRAALPKVHPFEIGSRGQLLEWEAEFEEPEPQHRHVSHLYGLHPGHEITPLETPELSEACRQTLAIRGDDGTGWSLGWKINMWARLHDGDHALRLIKRQLRFVDEKDTNYRNGGGTYMNLFDAHPPFQIDGNYGTCAGIAELFVQSYAQKLLLLPALPGEWRNGSMTGLRAKNGLEVDVYFEKGALKRALIRRIADCDKPIEVLYKEKSWTVNPKRGETVEIQY